MGKIFLGIDPGQTGSLAMIQPIDGRDDLSIKFFDPPILRLKGSGKTKLGMDRIKHEYNEAAMVNGLVELSSYGTEIVCILEKVSAMPGQGVTSMFNFGMGYGLWRGMLSALKIPYTLVHPATWKKVLMKDMPKEKDAARLRAIQLYPQVAEDLSRKKDIGRADALLLAHYGMTQQQPASSTFKVWGCDSSGFPTMLGAQSSLKKAEKHKQDMILAGWNRVAIFENDVELREKSSINH